MNIYLDTIGCRLNQSEIEIFSRQFRAAGHTLVGSPETADLVVVNTCTVTAQAASDSRQKIRQASRQGAAQIVVTGCWASLEPESAMGLSGVSRVVSNLDKDMLVTSLLDQQPGSIDIKFTQRQPLPGLHHRTRAFIKVQDGCNNRCAYCITCLARGSSRSRSIEVVLQDVCAALSGGSREIVLTGVHLGAWGVDLHPSGELRDLIQAVLAEPALPRLSLSSLEPWDLDAGFFELWQDERLCRHLHLPLQSGCQATLHRMARKITPQAFADLVTTARIAIPGLAVTTDVIAGFPGESEAEFAESLAFIRAMEFAGGHAFTYSARPGTVAARMPGQVPYALRKQRNRELRSLFEQAAQSFRATLVGSSLPVLWETAQAGMAQTWHLSGLTDNYCHVRAKADTNLWNQISRVTIIGKTEAGLQGIICGRNQVTR
jgi:threonylcarbamoyladenosine tRNA methylthiotransferase MtaB